METAKNDTHRGQHMRTVYKSLALAFVINALTGCQLREVAQTDAPATTSSPVLVALPSRPGKVDSTTQNSDEFIWRLVSQFAAPAPKRDNGTVVFETWASDGDIYTKTPAWPRRFQASVLRMAKHEAKTIAVPCDTAQGAATGNFPIGGDPMPCIAEEVRRNRPQFDFIVQNGLNTSAGLAAAFKRGTKIAMPLEAIAVKADWVPVVTLLRWLPPIESIANIRKFYHTTISEGTEYALLSLHISSRQNANWVWGTLEHQMTPGRCDYIGCHDTFGAMVPEVAPNKTAFNTQYGSCEKSPAWKQVMEAAQLSPVWQNYCLKSSQVDFTAPDGTPYVLGNSVTEGIVGNGTVAASSCIACHAYASFTADGGIDRRVGNVLPFNPTGTTIQAVLAGSMQYDFMWGVLLAANVKD
jgi:hypothetical protein